MRPIDADALAQDFEERCLEGAALIRSAPTVEAKPDLYKITNRNGEKLLIEDTWDDLTYPELKQRIGHQSGTAFDDWGIECVKCGAMPWAFSVYQFEDQTEIHEKCAAKRNRRAEANSTA